MRFLMNVTIPTADFNPLVKDGTAGGIIGQILEETQPEAVYFTEMNGNRGATLVVNVNDASDIPRYAEPWYLNFNATIEYRIAMTPEDLGKADLSKYKE